jgi:hypothetical protein
MEVELEPETCARDERINSERLLDGHNLPCIRA